MRTFPALFLRALVCLALFMYGTASVKGQNIGLNSTGASPHPSSVLDLTASDKGLLIPRVALTATNSAAPVSSPAVSLLVYNTATAGPNPETLVTPGYYYWSGSVWIRLAAPSTLISVPSLTTPQLRGGVAGDASAVILVEPGREGLFVYDAASTAADDSALVIKAGTRTYLRVFNGDVKPEWFGAVGNGVTDDTEAFQKALRHKSVRADRTYRITDNLVLPEQGSLFGKGTINFHFTSLKLGLVMANRSSLDGLTINMNSTVGGGSGQNNVCVLIGKKIQNEFVQYVRVSNITVSNNKPDGIRILIIGRSNDITLSNIVIKGNGIDGRGIHMEWGTLGATHLTGTTHPHNILIDGVVVTNMGGDPTVSTNDAIFLSGVYDVTIRNVHSDTSAFAVVRIFPGDYGSFYSSAEDQVKANTGIVLDGISGVNCRRHGLSVTGIGPLAPGVPIYSIPLLCKSSFFSNMEGGLVAGITFDQVRDCVVENTIVSGFYINTATQTGARNITFRNVTHRNSIWHGAYLHATSNPPEDINYYECLFENCGTGTAEGAGIRIDNARRPRVQNCLFGSVGTEIMRFGVNINSQTNPVGAMLLDNFVRNVKAAGIGYRIGVAGDTGLVYKMVGNRVNTGITFRDGSTAIPIDQN